MGLDWLGIGAIELVDKSTGPGESVFSRVREGQTVAGELEVADGVGGGEGER